jgi:RNA polymerase sigma-70 factor (ECF subfamily)
LAAELETRFLKLVRENRAKILRICRVYAWTAQDREDLYQEILFHVWRALPSLKQPDFASTWLYRIAMNTAISHVRKSTASKKARGGKASDRLEEVPDHRQQGEPSANSEVDALYGTIGRLDKVERAVITLFLEELTYEQIGEIMGLSASHVGVMLHRAKKKVAGWMQEGGST